MPLRDEARLAEIQSRLADHPTVPLGLWPTPLRPALKLSEAVGREVWLKRDDLCGVLLGGTKVRKLAFLLGAAVQEGADTVLTVGAAQSNHASLTAAACATVGLRCELVLGGPSRPSTGNLLFNRLAGATVHHIDSVDWQDLAAESARVAAELTGRGRRVVEIPLGGSNVLGALGAAVGYFELLEQCRAQGIAPAHIVHASGSGGTQAGLHTAWHWAGAAAAPSVYGVAVAKDAPELASTVAGLAAGLDQRFGGEGDLPLPKIVDGFRGERYGLVTDDARQGIREMLQREAVVVDPVYSAKAVAALLAQASWLPAGEGPVVFWHTGGSTGLFAKTDEVLTEA